jgi:hypothetical protein
MRTIIPASILLLSAAPLFSQIPRTSDGKPDLSGIWQAFNTANTDLADHVARRGSPAAQSVVQGSEIPYQPWALTKKKENYANRETLDPENKCYLPGVPRITYIGLPFQIFERPDLVTVLYEHAHANRFIYTNGTGHPKGPIDWWMGDSRGHWDGDTLVVDNTEFNDQTWFDHAGDFHSEDLHVVERYQLLDRDHINYQATIEDPKVFTRPWTIDMILYRRVEKDFQLLDYECYAFDREQYYP